MNLAHQFRGPLGQKAPTPERGTAAARRHLAAVKALPCVICAHPAPSDAHHVISGRFGSRKASDFQTIPLCKLCHQDGPEAIHRNKAAWEVRNGLDTEYLAVVADMLAGDLTPDDGHPEAEVKEIAGRLVGYRHGRRFRDFGDAADPASRAAADAWLEKESNK